MFSSPIVTARQASSTDTLSQANLISSLACQFAVQGICPICKISGGNWVELLLRPAGKLGWISPERLVKALYQRSGVAQTDRTIIELGLTWLGRQPSAMKLSINTHPETLLDRDFAIWLDSMMIDRGISPGQVALEIIEFADTVDLAGFLGELRRITELGCSIVLDDYGNGSTNLALLAEGLIDVIKLDRAIIRHVEAKPAYAALAENICRMASDLGVETVAEGVETAADHRKLEEIGVHWGQGYYHSKPELVEI